MLRMRYFALLFFVIGLMFFVFNITGNVILEDYVSSSLIGVVVLFSFLVAFLFMVKGKISLDAILVPCSNEEGLTRKRARRAVRAHKKYPDAMIVVSGGRTPELNPNYSSEAQIAYEVLKEAGIKSKNVKVETHSKDSIDNIRLSLKKIPNAKSLGIVSNRHQIKRLKKIIKKGKGEGAIPKDLKIYGIKTRESLKERIYEFPASILTNYLLRTKGYGGANLPEGKFKKTINNLLKPRNGKEVRKLNKVHLP